MLAPRRTVLAVLAPLLLAATTCGGEVSTADAGADSGNADAAAVCILSASHYTQSCNVASDCAKIFAGDACSPTFCLCPNAAIAQSSHPKYEADLAATNAVNTCFCPLSPGPFCCAGVCTLEACDAGH